MNRRNTPSTRKKNQIDSRQPASSRQGSGSIRSTQSAAIKGVALTIGYRDHAVCERLHFTVPKGAVSVLAPRDALCKAALLDLLTGRIRPESGRCLIEGREIHDLPLAIKQRIGVLETSERVYEVMTIGQTAVFFSGCYPQWCNQTYFRLTDSIGLSRRVKISNLPGHQRALVALAVLLARNPDLLILDDWITTFGDSTRTIVYDAIRRFAAQAGRTALLVGHHVGLTPDLVDHLILVGHSASLNIPTAGLTDATDLLAAAPSGDAADSRIGTGDKEGQNGDRIRPEQDNGHGRRQ